MEEEIRARLVKQEENTLFCEREVTSKVAKLEKRLNALEMHIHRSQDWYLFNAKKGFIKFYFNIRFCFQGCFKNFSGCSE